MDLRLVFQPYVDGYDVRDFIAETTARVEFNQLSIAVAWLRRDALRALLTPETTYWQYTTGVKDKTLVSPDGYNLDNFYMTRPGAHEVQLDLFLDYSSNVDMYPAFQDYFRRHQPPLLAVWGDGDPFFLPPGAEAFKRDIPKAEIKFFPTGHFALETHCEEIAQAIRSFLPTAM